MLVLANMENLNLMNSLKTCLIFIQALTPGNESEIRSHILIQL